ncbi:hypothetical protein [Streptomyces sp. KR80]|uniref:hypothetical protein n=1 Tax=Streptomyces sp. KR80 TaxID=3457426 RepID=UPI003FD5C07E
MEILAWTLIVLGFATTAACAVHLTRRRQRDASQLARSLHRTAPALLAVGLLPLPALLATDAPATVWGLWGAEAIVAALVYAAADARRDIPGPGAASRARSEP